MKLSYEVVSTVGNMRLCNQDNFYINGRTKEWVRNNDNLNGISESDNQVFAVFDGMGGESQGEIAAGMAADMLRSFQKDEDKVNWMEYVAAINQRICDYQEKKGVRMGTTMAGVSISPSNIITINIGDTRIYRIRDGMIKQLSVDHNEYQSIIKSGLDVSESVMRMAKSHLTQYLGIPETLFLIKPYQLAGKDICVGDKYLIGSDGLYDVLSEEDLIKIVFEAEQGACKKLVSKALSNGSRDNVTALLITVLDTNSQSQIKSSAWERIKSKCYQFK